LIILDIDVKMVILGGVKILGTILGNKHNLGLKLRLTDTFTSVAFKMTDAAEQLILT